MHTSAARGETQRDPDAPLALQQDLCLRNRGIALLRRYVSVNDWRARQKTAQAFREGTHYRRRPARDCPFRSLHIRTLRCSPPGRIEVVMASENLFRYPALAVGLKPSASQGEARLRGL